MEKQKQIKIALIEDHEGVRVSLQNFFEYCNFSVVLLAANGRMAMEILRMQQALPDVCILDINMPEMDGFQTAKELAENYPLVRILVFSSLDNKKILAEMLDLGARGYVLKGAPAENLKTAVIRLHEGAYYFSESIRSAALDYLAGKRDSQ